MGILILDLNELREGTVVSGQVVYIQSYAKKSFDNGTRAYISGNLGYKGKTVNFVIWDANLVNVFSSNDLNGQIAKITGDVKKYRNNLQVSIQSVDFKHDFHDVLLFMKSVDVEKVFNGFVNFINDNMSEKTVSFLSALFKAENLFDDFKKEFAGAKKHDAQIGGLMNHTYKMLKIMKTLIENDSRMKEYSDLLYLGVIMHDIGKVKEMNLGVYTENSFVTHRIFGIEIIAKYKEQMIDAFGEHFYYHLVAIVQGHHDQWGDKARTVWAYVVHLVDMVDSMTTGILDRIENNDVSEKNGGKYVYVVDSFLAL